MEIARLLYRRIVPLITFKIGHTAINMYVHMICIYIEMMKYLLQGIVNEALHSVE